MTGMHALIFADFAGETPWELTRHRTAACVPFGGRYRVIDFLLSSLQCASVRDVGILLSGGDRSLIDHLGSGKVWDMSRKHGGMKLLPVAPGAKSRMEMLADIGDYVHQIRRDYVLLAAADLTANLPLAEILKAHIRSGAEITAVCTPCTNGFLDTAQGAYFRVEEGRIAQTFFTKTPQSNARDLGIYLLSAKLLEEAIAACKTHGDMSLCDRIFCAAGNLSVHAFLWNGFAARIHSMRTYYRCSMALLDAAVRRDLFCPSRPVCAKEEGEGASYFSPDSHCRSSLIADGCRIEGQVENSILFPGVSVGPGAEVRNCILMKNTTVSDGVMLSCVVSDKNVTFEAGRTLIGHENYPIAVAKGSTV